MFKPNLTEEQYELLREMHKSIMNGDDARYQALKDSVKLMTPVTHLEICNTKNPKMFQ